MRMIRMTLCVIKNGRARYMSACGRRRCTSTSRGVPEVTLQTVDRAYVHQIKLEEKRHHEVRAVQVEADSSSLCNTWLKRQKRDKESPLPSSNPGCKICVRPRQKWLCSAEVGGSYHILHARVRSIDGEVWDFLQGTPRIGSLWLPMIQRMHLRRIGSLWLQGTPRIEKFETTHEYFLNSPRCGKGRSRWRNVRIPFFGVSRLTKTMLMHIRRY